MSRSKLDSVEIGGTLRETSDWRRHMVEIFSSPGITIRDAKTLEVLPQDDGKNVVIGGHWEKGLEIQYVLLGRIARLDLADVETQEEKSVSDITAGSRIMLPAGVAHRLIFDEPSLLLVCNEVPFVEEKCVVYPYRTPLPGPPMD